MARGRCDCGVCRGQCNHDIPESTIRRHRLTYGTWDGTSVPAHQSNNQPQQHNNQQDSPTSDSSSTEQEAESTSEDSDDVHTETETSSETENCFSESEHVDESGQKQPDAEDQPEQQQQPFDYHCPLYANATITVMLFLSFIYDWQIRHNVTEAAAEELVSFMAAVALPKENNLPTYSAAKRHTQQHSVPMYTHEVNGIPHEVHTHTTHTTTPTPLQSTILRFGAGNPSTTQN